MQLNYAFENTLSSVRWYVHQMPYILHKAKWKDVQLFVARISHVRMTLTITTIILIYSNNDFIQFHKETKIIYLRKSLIPSKSEWMEKSGLV